MPKLTRRVLMQLALAGTAAAQAPPEQAADHAAKLAAVKLPRDTEPAIVFKA